MRSASVDKNTEQAAKLWFKIVANLWFWRQVGEEDLTEMIKMLSGEDISRSSHNRKGDDLTITKFTTEPIVGLLGHLKIP